MHFLASEADTLESLPCRGEGLSGLSKKASVHPPSPIFENISHAKSLVCSVSCNAMASAGLGY